MDELDNILSTIDLEEEKNEVKEEYVDDSADRIYVVNQENEPDRPYGMEAEDHFVLENLTASSGYNGNKIVQQN